MQKNTVFERLFPLAAAMTAVLLLSACSPAYNWRNVPVEKAHLTVSLPCKPDQGERSVDMGPGKVDIGMIGCEAHGRLFALSYMEIKDPAQIAPTLALWHDAVRSQLQLPPVVPGTAPSEQPFVRKGALNLPQSVRMKEEGRAPDGRKLQVDAVWFARINGPVIQLVHAVVHADKRDDALADSFLESITLQ